MTFCFVTMFLLCLPTIRVFCFECKSPGEYIFEDKCFVLLMTPMYQQYYANVKDSCDNYYFDTYGNNDRVSSINSFYSLEEYNFITPLLAGKTFWIGLKKKITWTPASQYDVDQYTWDNKSPALYLYHDINCDGDATQQSVFKTGMGFRWDDHETIGSLQHFPLCQYPIRDCSVMTYCYQPNIYCFGKGTCDCQYCNCYPDYYGDRCEERIITTSIYDNSSKTITFNYSSTIVNKPDCSHLQFSDNNNYCMGSYIFAYPGKRANFSTFLIITPYDITDKIINEDLTFFIFPMTSHYNPQKVEIIITIPGVFPRSDTIQEDTRNTDTTDTIPITTLDIPWDLIGGIGGGVFALIMFLLICVCIAISLLCLIISIKKRKNGDGDREKSTEMTIHEPKKARISIHQDLGEINVNDVKLLEIIGTGGGGAIVYMAEWNGKKCAYKHFITKSMLNSSSNNDRFQEFESEVSILASVNHPNILQFYGATLHEPKIGIVMELCKLDLQTAIEGKHIPSMREKIRIIFEIAEGMSYLHMRRILHRDLKPGNVLLTDEKRLIPKIMDFGLAKIQSKNIQTKHVGTAYYMAPEVVLGGGKYDGKCDVFSFSVMAYQIITDVVSPYGDDGIMNIEMKVARDENCRPNLNLRVFKQNKLEWMSHLLKQSWAHERTERLDFDGIIKTIKENTKL